LTQILTNISAKLLLNKKKIYFLIIVLNSFLFTFYYGYRGIFPLDSFLIFDAGYKVLNNIHPFKDYWSITGPLLDYIQFSLFYLFNVNWLSYVLHAALINCLLASLSYFFFLNIGLNFFFAFIYSICISILAYPITGTPFMDLHAVIFSLLSIIFLILALIKNEKKFWFFSPVFLALSFFSKQIPSAYIGILLGIIILMYVFLIKKNNNNFIYFFIGGAISILLFLNLLYFNQIPIKNFLIQYIYYPMTIGDERMVNTTFDLKNTLFQFKFIYISVLPLLIVLFFLAKVKNKNRESRIDLLILILIFSSVLIFIYTQMLTKNQILIFFLVPFFLGISHFYISKYLNKKIIIYLILIVLLISTSKYHLRFNEQKKFMEFKNADFSRAIDGKILDTKLTGLKWITPDYIKEPSLELKLLNEAKQILIKDKKNKIIVSDYQILPAITKSANYAPNKWFDVLSVPSKTNKYFNDYKSFFLFKIKEQKIENIYIIGRSKLDFLLLIFNEKECLNYKRLNDITVKLEIKNCIM